MRPWVSLSAAKPSVAPTASSACLLVIMAFSRAYFTYGGKPKNRRRRRCYAPEHRPIIDGGTFMFAGLPNRTCPRNASRPRKQEKVAPKRAGVAWTRTDAVPDGI